MEEGIQVMLLGLGVVFLVLSLLVLLMAGLPRLDRLLGGSAGAVSPPHSENPDEETLAAVTVAVAAYLRSEQEIPSR